VWLCFAKRGWAGGSARWFNSKKEAIDHFKNKGKMIQSIFGKPIKFVRDY
jgi:hypothetical protein